MISLIEEKRTQLAEHCKAYSVKRLYLFGSAARDEFDQNNSDLDFLVAFHENLPPEIIGRNMLALNEALEGLFQRKVDLIRERRFRNPVLGAGSPTVKRRHTFPLGLNL